MLCFPLPYPAVGLCFRSGTPAQRGAVSVLQPRRWPELKAVPQLNCSSSCSAAASASPWQLRGANSCCLRRFWWREMISETNVLPAHYWHMGRVNEIYFGISFTSQSIFSSTFLPSSLYVERSISLIMDVRHIGAICSSAKCPHATGTLLHQV